MAELEFRAEVLATQPPPAMELGKAKSRATAGVMLLVGGLLAVPYLDRDATIDPLALDFGAQEIGTVSPGQALLVSNAGWSTFQVEGVAILGEHLLDFQVVEDECSGGAIAPRRSCRMLLQFSPRDRRERRARLPITASDDRTLQQVQLSGGGMLLSVGVQPGFVDFGDQLLKTASPPQSVAIANVGDSPLRIHQIEIDRRGRAAFRMSGQNCSDRLLEPAAQCRMQVRFAPPALVGDHQGKLTVHHDAPGHLQQVLLVGMATQVKIGGDLVPPRPIFEPEPVYPPEARRAEIRGTVVIRAIISNRGDIRDPRVLSGPPSLREAALAAVRARRYDPARLNGVPVDHASRIEVNFELTESPPPASPPEGSEPPPKERQDFQQSPPERGIRSRLHPRISHLHPRISRLRYRSSLPAPSLRAYYGKARAGMVRRGGAGAVMTGRSGG